MSESMHLGVTTGSKRIRHAVLGHIFLAGLCCCLVTSCGQADDAASPLEPPPPASLSDLFGSVLYESDGTVVGFETIEGKTIVGIYFGAGWCSACAGFTPLLTSFYEELQQAGKSFEVVFVSFDRSVDDMFAHMTDRAMPWPAVPFGGDKGAALVQRYDVRGIPTLIVLDGEGNTITEAGRVDVATKGALAYDDWIAVSGR